MCRRICGMPGATYYKPAGVPADSLLHETVSMDEAEALRLKDSIGMEQTEAASVMGISQPTFHRMLCSARRKVASALTDGKAIRIEGGNYRIEEVKRMPGEDGTGPAWANGNWTCRRRMGMGGGRGWETRGMPAEDSKEAVKKRIAALREEADRLSKQIEG